MYSKRKKLYTNKGLSPFDSFEGATEFRLSNSIHNASCGSVSWVLVAFASHASFEPNSFRPKKCIQCFRDRELHTASSQLTLDEPAVKQTQTPALTWQATPAVQEVRVKSEFESYGRVREEDFHN